MKVEFSARAERELFAQLDWLANRSPTAARNAADRIDAVVLLLGDFPFAAPAVGRIFREQLVEFGRGGFVLRYRVRDSSVIIVRVLHGRQKR